MNGPNSWTFHWVIVLASLGVFGVLAEGVCGEWAVTDLDGRVTAGLAEHATTQPVLVDCFGVLTQMGGVSANALLSLLVVTVLFVSGRRTKADAERFHGS